MRILIAALTATSGLLAGCSTSFWYTQVQAAQYDNCEKLPGSEDRRRCKAETYPDHDKYSKQHESAKGTPK